MIVRPGAGVLPLALLIGAFFLVVGVFRMVSAGMMRPPNWGWLLTTGIVTLCLGLLIVSEWPASGPWVIGMFLGIDLVCSGIWLTMLALGLRHVAREIERRQLDQPNASRAA